MNMSAPAFAGTLDAIADGIMCSDEAKVTPDWRGIESRLWTLMIIARRKADTLDAQMVDVICNLPETKNV